MKKFLTILFLLYSINLCYASDRCVPTHESGWCDRTIDTAHKAYIYAQIASNTYEDGFYFKLPTNFKLVKISQNDNFGLAYSVYERYENNVLSEVILSFRGTENNLKDWIYGNIKYGQNNKGLELYRSLMMQYKDIPINIVGHSLGGAIALHIAVNLNETEEKNLANVFVFNASPHFKILDKSNISAKSDSLKNKINSIVEYGEVLKVLRWPGRETTQTYTSIGCSAGNPAEQHAQAKLATCLTQIAALKDEVAKNSLKENHLPYRFSQSFH